MLIASLIAQSSTNLASIVLKRLIELGAVTLFTFIVVVALICLQRRKKRAKQAETQALEQGSEPTDQPVP